MRILFLVLLVIAPILFQAGLRIFFVPQMEQTEEELISVIKDYQTFSDVAYSHEVESNETAMALAKIEYFSESSLAVPNIIIMTVYRNHGQEEQVRHVLLSAYSRLDSDYEVYTLLSATKREWRREAGAAVAGPDDHHLQRIDLPDDVIASFNECLNYLENRFLANVRLIADLAFSRGRCNSKFPVSV